jgi:hypothetical protein
MKLQMPLKEHLSCFPRVLSSFHNHRPSFHRANQNQTPIARSFPKNTLVTIKPEEKKDRMDL